MTGLKKNMYVGYNGELPMSDSATFSGMNMWNVVGSGMSMYPIGYDLVTPQEITVVEIDRKCEYCGKPTPDWFYEKYKECNRCGA